MKPESLQALLIDRELGELPAEAVELLDSWLAEHPGSATAVPELRRAIETTRATVRRFPELARAGAAGESAATESASLRPGGGRWRLFPLAWAAAVLVLAGSTAWLGFRAGRLSSPKEIGATGAGEGLAPAELPKPSAGPWARYALVANPSGGLTVVRRDINPER